MIPIDLSFVVIGTALILSILASRLATRLGVPILLAFMGIGMLAGSDGPGKVWFTDAQLAQHIGVVALTFILFAGGMELDWKSSRSSVWKALSLSTVGVICTTAVIGYAAHLILRFDLVDSLLLGAIVSSTDVAAVFSSIQQSQFKLRNDLGQILEMESGSNDPAAIFLTVTLIRFSNPSSTVAPAEMWLAPLGFVWEMVLGAFGGWAIGRLGVLIMRKLQLDHEGMYHGLSVAVLLIAFGSVSLLHGNGFFAAYIAGITFGNGEFRQRKGLRRFHDGIAWIMQILMFIVLGLLVFPKQLPGVVVPGILVSLLLMFVARPLGVLLALAPFRSSWKEITFISWAGLRGAVPIVLATFPLLAKMPRAQEFFNIVFFVVILSSLLQSPTLPKLANKLSLMQP